MIAFVPLRMFVILLLVAANAFLCGGRIRAGQCPGNAHSAAD